MAATFGYLKNGDNRIYEALLTADSADSNFPAANVAVLPVSKAWHTAAGKIGNQKLRIDFPVARTVDTFALVGHNISSGATITLNGGTSPDPSGDIVETITWVEGTAWKAITSVSRKHWSITIDDEGSEFGHIAVGHIVIGQRTSLTQVWAIDWQKIRETVFREAENELLVPMVGLEIAKGSSFNLSFRLMSDTNRDQLSDFLVTLGGPVTPMFIILDTTAKEANFGRFRPDEGFVMEQVTSALTDINDLLFRQDNLGIQVVPAPPFHYEP